METQDCLRLKHLHYKCRAVSGHISDEHGISQRDSPWGQNMEEKYFLRKQSASGSSASACSIDNQMLDWQMRLLSRQCLPLKLYRVTSQRSSLDLSVLTDFLQGLDFGVEVVLLLGSWAIASQIESILDLSFLLCRWGFSKCLLCLIQRAVHRRRKVPGFTRWVSSWKLGRAYDLVLIHIWSPSYRRVDIVVPVQGWVV